jgi:hypothetical protein
MNSLLAGVDASITSSDHYQPKGYADPAEWTIRRFCKAYCQDLFDFKAFDAWWVPDKYRNPQWDLLSTCTIKGRPGLLLVEAKANDSEVKVEGKSLAVNASEQTRINHEIIGQCISEAASDLNKRFPGGGINISRDSHYQLSNRIATAWKLASCGLPVILLYLGFTGDEGIRNVGEPFIDNDHWQRIMGKYMSGVLPLHFPGKKIDFDSGGSIRMSIEPDP